MNPIVSKAQISSKFNEFDINIRFFGGICESFTKIDGDDAVISGMQNENGTLESLNGFIGLHDESRFDPTINQDFVEPFSKP